MGYYITLFIGFLFGFCIASIFSGNRVDEAMENGYRKGYKDGSDGEPSKVIIR